MDTLSRLPAEEKCDCGWDYRGQCFGSCYGQPEKGGAGLRSMLPDWQVNRNRLAYQESIKPVSISKHQAREIVRALDPFAAMIEWIEALVELGEIDPITDRQVVTQISGGGGHATISVGELRAAREALGIFKDIKIDAPF